MKTNPRYFQVERDGPVIVWKYSNPPRNLLIPDAWDELVGLVKQFDADPDLRVGIVTSAVPGMFIQHFDASVLLAWADAMNKMSDEEVSQMLASLPRPCGIFSSFRSCLIHNRPGDPDRWRTWDLIPSDG